MIQTLLDRSEKIIPSQRQLQVRYASFARDDVRELRAKLEGEKRLPLSELVGYRA